MKTLISVTQADIRGGAIGEDNCPVALAIRRAGHGGLVNPLGRIRFRDSVTKQLWGPYVRQSRSLQRFVARYDKGKACKPFRFYLNHP